MARRRWRRRISITAIAATLAAAVIGLVVTGSREPASALRLLTGAAWLGNSSTGTVTHVDGYTGGTDAQARVGKAGDPFEVVQRDDGAYVLDLRTGRLSRLDDATLGVATTATQPGPASALQVVTGTNTTWVLDRSSGILQQLNPSTLAPVGRQIALGGPTGLATIDPDGSVWVPVAAQAVVDQADPAGTVTRHPFGRTGDAVQVAETSSGVWAVDPQSATAASLQDPSLHQVALPDLTPQRVPLVGASSSSPEVVVVAGTRILDIDTTRPSLSSLVLPQAARSTQLAVASGRAYLLDASAGQLDTVDLAPLLVLAPIRVPPSANQLITKDQLVFVNSTRSAQALVVNASGTATAIAKYVPAAAAPAPKHGAAGPAAGATGPAPTPGGSPGPTAPTPGSPGSPTSVPPSAAPVPTTAPVPAAAPPPTTPPRTSQPPTVPGAPTVTQISAGNGLVTVSWAPPASDGGSPVLHYQVTATPSGSRAGVGAGTTTVTLTGQPNGTRECVQVQAVNAVGGGPLSPADQSCATPLADSPGPVGGVRAAESAPGQITLTWRQPGLGPYHTPIARYTVKGGPAPVTTSTTGATVTGLADATAYSFTVVATNRTGNTGPASAPVHAVTWSAPGAVGNLTVTGGDDRLTITWKAASVPSGSPASTGYMVTIGKNSPVSTRATTMTKTVGAWTNQAVAVYAVNRVGPGPRSTASGTAWARTSPHNCHNVLSGDTATENACPAPGGAWVDQGASSIRWISSQPPRSPLPSGTNEYLCTTYYTGAVSGDLYALVTRPTNAACTAKLPGYQTPDTPHPIAYVSTKPIDNSSQQICEYKGTTTGSQTRTSFELSRCGQIPSGLAGATKQFSFYT